MPKQALSPNVPDIEPEYVDLDGRSASTPSSPSLPPPDRETDVKDANGTEAAAPVSLAAAHFLNAELVDTPTDAPTPTPEPEPDSAPPPTLRQVEETVLDATGIPLVSEPDAASSGAGAGQPPVQSEADTAARHRQGECIPNIPDARPDLVSPETLPKPPAKTAPEPLSFVEPPEGGPSWFRWETVLAVLIIAGFGLLVFSQAISALAMASTLPVWARYLLLIPLGVCCLAVLWVCVAVLAAWLRLRAVRQVDLRALEELRLREQTRRDGVERCQEARGELERYLREYPLTPDGFRKLKASGLDAAVCERLARDRDYLFARTTDSMSWLADFRDHFQAALDSAARARVKYWAVRAAGCVIASPIPLLDAALILGISMKMIGDLCFIYNVRGGRSTSLVLLNRAVFAAFIAGVAEDATTYATEAAGEELTSIFGESALGALGAGVARVVTPKLGEGAINAFFVNRLGKAAIRLLQPLRPK